MLNGYQRENERMVTKDNLQKKEIDQYQTELQDLFIFDRLMVLIFFIKNFKYKY